jgi:hypothetical protein
VNKGAGINIKEEMCGHGLVSGHLVKRMVADIKKKKNHRGKGGPRAGQALPVRDLQSLPGGQTLDENDGGMI